MRFFHESIVYFLAKSVGYVVSRMPMCVSLALGRCLGIVGYHIDTKHRAIAYANLKAAFGKTKRPAELRRIVRQSFKNFGQNVVEVYQLPILYRRGVENFITVEGKEHVFGALEKKKGVILLAMHFGSWEMTSLTSTLLGHPYRVIVKPQKSFSRLDELLNSYRQCGGSSVVVRGRSTREFIVSLNNNEVVGMVVDQGGRGGMPVKFFGRDASMSVGAVRVGLKLGVSVCFAVLIRDKGAHHRLIVHPPLELIATGNIEQDVRVNLERTVVPLMERFIAQYPAEYMWFYKIWKYSHEAHIVIVSDDKLGHLRQSQAVAGALRVALSERDINATTETIDIRFKSAFSRFIVKMIGTLIPGWFAQGRIEFLRHYLAEESYRKLVSAKADFVVSCGSSVAGINFLLSRENNARNIAVLRPSFMRLSRFNLVILPQHDVVRGRSTGGVVVTSAAPNVVTPHYLDEKSQQLLSRYSHLKGSKKRKIGVLIGGDTKETCLDEAQMKIVVNQLKEAAERIDADILLTTSRRTSVQVENIIYRALKPFERCQLLVIENRNSVSEAVGGILGLSEIVIVSGDSVSMVSEAASSGKQVLVFPVRVKKKSLLMRNKHRSFVERLRAQGYVVSCQEKMISHFVCEMAKNKISTKVLNDHAIILDAARMVI